jgi:O-antigen/teichoic acid export membrane protein
VTAHEHGSDARTLTRGIAANAATLAAMSVRGVMSVVIARTLGGAALGAFLLAFAWMDVLSTIGVFGLDNAALTFVARARGLGRAWAARPILRAAALAALGASLVPMLAVLLAVAAGWPRSIRAGGVGLALAVMAPTIPALAVGRVCAAVARGLRVMDVDLYAHGITGTVVMLGGLALTLALGVGEAGPSLAVTIGTFAALAVAAGMTARVVSDAAVAPATPGGAPQSGRAAGVAATDDPARGLLRFAVPVAGTSILGLLLTRLDVLLLGFFVGSAPGVTPFTVGAYAAAAEWAGGLRKLRQVFDQAFAPIVAQASTGGLGAGDGTPAGQPAVGPAVSAQARLEQVATWILLLVCPIVALTALSGGSSGWRPPGWSCWWWRPARTACSACSRP